MPSTTRACHQSPPCGGVDSLNFAQVPDYGLVIADPYLIGPAEPVWVERELMMKGN